MMINHVTTGFSKESESDALATALGHASSFGKDAETIHIIVLNVFSLGEGKGWKAVVRVVLEPKVKEKKGEKDKEKEEDGVNNKGAIKENVEGGEVYVHLHLPNEYESLLDNINISPEFTEVHVVAGEALWENVQKMFPDIDFYEAVYEKEFGGHSIEDMHVHDFEKSLLKKIKNRLNGPHIL